MVKAFQNFDKIEKLKDIQQKHREWLKQYEGKKYSFGIDGHHKKDWKWTESSYNNKYFEAPLNLIGKLKNRTRIEFDDENNKIAMENLEKTMVKLKELGIGFIRSTHKGKCDYLWVEFTRDMKDKELKQFLAWIAPTDSIIDINFTSSRKVFPVLYAIHWRHSYERELPIEFFEGEQIDYDKLGIEPIERLRKTIKTRTFEYETFIKEAGKVFSKKGQAETFNKVQPLFYDKSKMWWLWNHKSFCWELVDEVDILNMIYEATGMDIISSKSRNEILNGLKQEGRKKIPKTIKKTWVQFKEIIIDIKTGEEFKASPEYFVTNPIPWEISKDKFIETPVMDKIFEEWVGKDHIKILYEILSYCLLPSYPIHRLFCFIGDGLNGKTCFLRLLKKFIGKENVTATELDTLLDSRFEKTRLHKKLVCIMGETNFSQIEKTSIIKKLTGQDTIGFEYKNKDPFEDMNYAKILIATNNLPTTTDKTVGFYRRWCIIDFPNRFSEEKDILSDIPEEEYKYLALKCTFLLKDLLNNRKFHKEGSIEERTKKYEEKSNPFEKFINEFCDLEDVNAFITKNQFEIKLNEWLRENRFRNMSDRTINKLMKEKEVDDDKEYIEWWKENTKIKKQVRVWRGIRWEK